MAARCRPVTLRDYNADKRVKGIAPSVELIGFRVDFSLHWKARATYLLEKQIFPSFLLSIYFNIP